MSNKSNAMVTWGVYAAAVVAVFLGIYHTSLLTQLGVHRVVTTFDGSLVGITPAYGAAASETVSWDLFKGVDLTGQTAIVTGASSPIGLAISEALAQLGAGVVMGCEDDEICEELAAKIRAHPNTTGVVTPVHLDTNFVGSIKWFAQNFRRVHPFPSTLDMLFLNEDRLHGDPIRHVCVPVNDQEVQATFAANFVGHHMLYRWMYPYLNYSKFARVVSTSSPASFNTYDFGLAKNIHQLNKVCAASGLQATDIALSYGHAKLAQLVWTKYLTRKSIESNSNIIYNAFYPGQVEGDDTALHKERLPTGAYTWSQWLTHALFALEKPVRWTPTDSALTGLILGAAVDKLQAEGIRGQYFHPHMQPVKTHPLADNIKAQDDLWEFSEQLVKDFLPFEDWSRASEEEDE